MIFDIETVADPDVIPFLDPPEAPSNYKDPAKIQEYVANAKKRQVEQLALRPWGCRIIAIGITVNNGQPLTMTARTPDDEGRILGTFWQTWKLSHDNVGFNVLGFDLPVLIVRSRLLGVEMPIINYSKYRCDHVIDLMRVLDPTGEDPKSLTFWCKRLNLDVPDDTVTGADIADLYAKGGHEAWLAISAHCDRDVIKTKALYQRLFPVGSDVF